MSSTRKQWLLKVIAGPHQGAEIGLYAGKTLVGSDDECDVVLHDILVAPQHLELELADTGITAAPLGGRVFANGKRIREARLAVPDFGFLSIGGTHLVVGPADGKWPLLSAADIPELEKETETPTESKPEEEGAANDSADTAGPEGPKPIVATAAVPLAPAPQPSSKAGPILGIAAGLLLLLGWAVVYSGLSGGAAKSEAVEETTAERARAVVEEMGAVGSIQVEESAGGRVSITGYVDTEVRQRELQMALREAVPGTRIKIYSLEKIASTARSLIDVRQLPLTVSSLSEGKLKISGKLPSADPWILMRQSLMREVPGISGIEDSVEIEAPRPGTPNTVFVSVPGMVPPGADYSQDRQAATSAAASTPAAGSASLTPAIVPAPAPQAAMPAAAASVPSSDPAQVPQPDPVTDYLVTPDTIDTPEATVASINPSDDGLAFVRLSTGGVYFVGARLPFGGTVAKIDAETVTIVEKGVTRTLRQGDSAMKAKTTSSLSAP